MFQERKYIMRWFGWWYWLPSLVTSRPYYECPSWMRTNGFVNEMGLLADAVSWSGVSVVEGVCGNYTVSHDVSGKYDTRMRIYQSQNHNLTVIAFRPTQSTPEGQQIHADRHMAPCVFFPHCQGKVHARFQEAFQSLVEKINDWDRVLERPIATVGHSLGGSLQLFMGLFLLEKFNRAPVLALGFAGPFIGDVVFSKDHMDPFWGMMGHNGWQIETVDVDHPDQYDGTVEGYQVGNQEIWVGMEALCSFPIHPLSVPDQSYGMHDLRQYRLFLLGTEC